MGITTCQLGLTETQEVVAGASRTQTRLEIAFAASSRSQAASPKGRPGAVTAATKDAADKLAATFSAKGEES